MSTCGRMNCSRVEYYFLSHYGHPADLAAAPKSKSFSGLHGVRAPNSISSNRFLDSITSIMGELLCQMNAKPFIPLTSAVHSVAINSSAVSSRFWNRFRRRHLINLSDSYFEDAKLVPESSRTTSNSSRSFLKKGSIKGPPLRLAFPLSYTHFMLYFFYESLIIL